MENFCIRIVFTFQEDLDPLQHTEKQNKCRWSFISINVSCNHISSEHVKIHTNLLITAKNQFIEISCLTG